MSALMVLTVLLLCGCSNEKSAVVLPVKSTIVYDDTFRITCLSRQYEYNADEMQKDAPLHFELQLEYIGRDASVTVWHSIPIGGFQLLDQDHKFLYYPQAFLDSLCETELEKGEVYTVCTWTGTDEYEFLGGFFCGDYIAEALVEFSYLENGTEEDVCCSLELPFKIV